MRIVHKHRIVRSETVPFDGDLVGALTELCARLDLPRPMLLPKHEREWAGFRRTTFLKDHFIERVPFDRMEIELIDPDAKKRKNPDPRNG